MREESLDKVRHLGSWRRNNGHVSISETLNNSIPTLTSFGKRTDSNITTQEAKSSVQEGLSPG